MPKLTKSNLKKIKSKLPNGAVALIAHSLNVSAGHVSNVLNGNKEDNHGILLLAANYAKENHASLQAKLQETQKIIKNL